MNNECLNFSSSTIRSSRCSRILSERTKPHSDPSRPDSPNLPSRPFPLKKRQIEGILFRRNFKKLTGKKEQTPARYFRFSLPSLAGDSFDLVQLNRDAKVKFWHFKVRKYP